MRPTSHGSHKEEDDDVDDGQEIIDSEETIKCDDRILEIVLDYSFIRSFEIITKEKRKKNIPRQICAN